MYHYWAKAVKSWGASSICLFALVTDNLEPNISDIGEQPDFLEKVNL